MKVLHLNMFATVALIVTLAAAPPVDAGQKVE
jgi:hypothetical protein